MRLKQFYKSPTVLLVKPMIYEKPRKKQGSKMWVSFENKVLILFSLNMQEKT